MTRTYRLTLTAGGYRTMRTPTGRVWVTGPSDLQAADPLATIPVEDRLAVADLLARSSDDDWCDGAKIVCGSDTPAETAAKVKAAAVWRQTEALQRRMDDPDGDH